MAFFRKDTVAALENQLVAAEKAAAEATADAAAALDDPAMTPGKLAPIQAAEALATHRAGKVRADLAAAREKAAADALEAEAEALQADARKAGDESEKARPEAVAALRTFVAAWGRIEAARGTADSAESVLRRKWGRDLEDRRALDGPGRDRWIGEVFKDGWGSGGRFIREEIEGFGFLLPKS